MKKGSLPSPRTLSPRLLQTQPVLETLVMQTTLTQDIMTGMLRLIEGAMQTGQGYARVQLLRQTHCHFRYSTHEGGTMTLPIHDAQTMAPLEGGSRQRAQLARPAYDIVLWLRSQGLGVLCTTSAMLKGRLNREPALAPWIYLVAVFVPAEEASSLSIAPDARLRMRWNSVYMPKCLDPDIAIDGWAGRVQRAIAIGASHCLLCTLYRGSDFTEIAVDEPDATLVAAAPRDHLTMQVLAACRWVLDPRLIVLVGFARQCGYAWTLCHPAEEPSWAYFVVLLDPLTQYEQLLTSPSSHTPRSATQSDTDPVMRTTKNM
jgi:hypothetical protein